MEHDAAEDAGVSSSAVDQTVRQILDLIRNRAMSVGDVLPTERELCELFGTSRNTIREALRTIRTYGLIDPKPRVGAVLADRQNVAIQNFFAAQEFFVQDLRQRAERNALVQNVLQFNVAA